MENSKTFRVVIEFDSVVADSHHDAAQIVSEYLSNPLDLLYEVSDEEDEVGEFYLIDLKKKNKFGEPI
jgi:hypothetical protein